MLLLIMFPVDQLTNDSNSISISSKSMLQRRELKAYMLHQGNEMKRKKRLMKKKNRSLDLFFLSSTLH